MELLLHADVITYLVSFLEARDVLHLGMACKLLRDRVLDNNRLWRHYVVARFPGIPTESLKDNDVDWKGLAFCKESAVAERQLQLVHLKRKLSADMKSKEFLRIYCKVSTVARVYQYRLTQTALPDIVLLGEDVSFQETNGTLEIDFTHKKMGSILFYLGESSVESSLVFYAVDRAMNGRIIPLEPARVREKETTLSRKQYEEVGAVAKNDRNFYTDGTFQNAKYQYNDGHASMRGASEYRFGSNNKTFALDLPAIRVKALTKISASFPLELLYSVFCTKPGWENAMSYMENRKRQKAFPLAEEEEGV